MFMEQNNVKDNKDGVRKRSDSYSNMSQLIIQSKVGEASKAL